MNKKVNNRAVMIESVITFLGDHPPTPPIVRVTDLTGLLNTVVTTLRSHDLDQDTGRSEARAAIVALRGKATALRADMRKVSGIAKGLSRELHPGLAAQFRMPKNSYKALLTRANSFLEALSPVKAELIARGLPANFDEELQEKTAEFEALTQRRNRGLTEQVGGTAGLAELSKVGVAHVAELDSMLSARYADDPALKAAWASAKRVRRANSSRAVASNGAPAPAPAPAPTSPTPAA